MSTVFLLLLLLTITTSLTSACNPLDEAALLAFKNSFPSDPFPDWSPSSDCCSWSGIRCKKTNGRVRYLFIEDNPNITGTLPATIGNITELEVLEIFHQPNLIGPFPPQLAKLTKLQSLVADYTGLSGHIPSYLSKFTQLNALLLRYCNFHGPIPPSLATLTKLNDIDLSGNKLTGTIPPLYSKYQHTGTRFPFLDLSVNELSGPIPPSFDTVPFSHIDLSHNKLTGDVSPIFGKSKQADEIHLQHNRLSFDLTHVEYPEKNFLTVVDLSHNQIYGNISPQIINSTVFDLNVSYNKLCGELPPLPEKIITTNGAPGFEHNKCLCGNPLPPCK